MIRAGLFVASLRLVALACGDGTGPTSIEDTYLLVAENGVPLPSER